MDETQDTLGGCRTQEGSRYAVDATDEQTDRQTSKFYIIIA